MKTLTKVLACVAVFLIGGLLAGESSQNGQLVTDTRETIDEISEEVVEIEHHLHGSNYVYGLNAAAPVLLTRPSTTAIRVTGGTDAFGTSVLLYKGDGSISGAYFEPSKIQVIAVDEPSRATNRSL